MKRFLAMLIAAATLTFGGMAHAEEPEPFDLNGGTAHGHSGRQYHGRTGQGHY